MTFTIFLCASIPSVTLILTDNRYLPYIETIETFSRMYLTYSTIFFEYRWEFFRELVAYFLSFASCGLITEGDGKAQLASVTVMLVFTQTKFCRTRTIRIGSEKKGTFNLFGLFLLVSSSGWDELKVEKNLHSFTVHSLPFAFHKLFGRLVPGASLQNLQILWICDDKNKLRPGNKGGNKNSLLYLCLMVWLGLSEIGRRLGCRTVG